MASIFLIISILAAILWVDAGGVSDAFVKVVCKPKHVVELGQKTLLECVVQTSQAVVDAKIDVVAWKAIKDGEEIPLVVYQNGKIYKHQPGFGLVEKWDETNMNVSLVIDATSLTNAGEFVCTVVTDSGDGENTTNLQVTARYNNPVIHSIPEKITGNSDSVLICDADGGYPAGQIRWYVEDNTDWTKSAKMMVDKTPNGLLHLSSKLSLLAGSTFSKYTCVVFNASGGKEAETVFVVDFKPQGMGGDKAQETATKIVAPVVVIGSLITGLLLFMLLMRCRRRSRRNNHPEVFYTDIEEGGRYKMDETPPAAL